MDELSVVKFVGIFFAMLFSDIIWVFYIRRVSQGKATQAALSSMVIIILSAFIITGYVENILYLIPTAVGAAAGTFLATKLDRKIAIRIHNHKRL